MPFSSSLIFSCIFLSLSLSLSLSKDSDSDSDSDSDNRILFFSSRRNEMKWNECIGEPHSLHSSLLSTSSYLKIRRW